MEETAGAVASGDREDLRRRQQQQQQQHRKDEAEEEMREEGGRRHRPSRHELHHGKGSWTTAFVALDYMFLLVFFGLLCFFFVQIWRGSGDGGGSFA